MGVILICVIGSLGVQLWAWRSLTWRLQAGSITRLRSVLRYTGWALLPVVLFVAGFAAMAGIEEWLQVALIEERAALLAIPVLGLSVLGTASFAIRCAFVRRR